MKNSRNFDLNIQDVLEDWVISDAIREIISNALDEYLLTKSNPIEVAWSNGTLAIKDFGRGISYEHFTQNENSEKLNNPEVIGKFGVGLKDALATLYRHNVEVSIESKNAFVTLNQSSKSGFEDVVTLQAVISEPRDQRFIGTEFILKEISKNDLELAKQNFLYFNKPTLLEKNEYGEVYERSDDKSYIYINGVRVSEEENFLFSYNITKKNAAINKALNRERTNVGRSAYTQSIKNILLNSKSKSTINRIVSNLKENQQKDELGWKEIERYAVLKANELLNVTFISHSSYFEMPTSQREELERNNKELIFVKDSTYDSLPDTDSSGTPIMTAHEVFRQDSKKYEYSFIDYSDLLPKEKHLLSLIPKIIQYLGYDKYYVDRIRISESINPYDALTHAAGLYRSHPFDDIIIKRSQLANLDDFLGTVIHELVHANLGLDDVTREFESELTNIIGKLAKSKFGKYEKSNMNKIDNSKRTSNNDKNVTSTSQIKKDRKGLFSKWWK